MRNPRSPVYLITGLIIGLALGVAYAWVWTPVEAIEARPQDLRSDFKDAYRELIARAYHANNDLGRAAQRLSLLGDEDPARALAVQAQITLGQDGSAEVARALGSLAAALQNQAGAPPVSQEPLSPETTITLAAATAFSQASGSPSPTNPAPTNTSLPASSQLTQTIDPAASTAASTAVPTHTPTPTPTPTATPGPPFVLLDIPLECNPNIDPPLIRVYVFDGAGNPVPGVAIIVSWDGNSNRFVTGLKPEYGLGYADFTMDPSVTYSLRLEAGGDPINSITGRLCEDQAEPYWGSWRLNFVQP
jgi:hypothetical protein